MNSFVLAPYLTLQALSYQVVIIDFTLCLERLPMISNEYYGLEASMEV